jgi:hypothetical protein
MFRPTAPDFGTFGGFTSGLSQGASQSLTATAGRVAKYWIADLQSDEDPISETEFNSTLAIPGGPKWRDGMSRERARMMFEDTLDDRLAATGSAGHGTASLVGNLVGGMAADLPLNFIPAVGPTGRGLVFTGNMTLINTEREMMKAVARFGARATNVFASGVYQGAVQTGGLAVLSPYAGREYTMDDAAMDLFGTFLTSAAFGIGQGSMAHVNKSWKDTVSDAYFIQAANGQRPSDTIGAALRAADPVAQQAAELAAKARESVGGNGPVDTGSVIGDQAGKRDVGFISRDLDDVAMARPAYYVEPVKLKNWREPGDSGSSPAENIRIAEETQRLPNSGLTPNQAEYVNNLRAQKERARLRQQEQLKINKELETSTAEKARRKIVRDESYAAKSDDEAFLADVWKRSFGVDLRFFSDDVSKRAGVYGLLNRSDPTKAYVRSGLLHGAPDSMVVIAGHELGHSIRFRDTSLWTNITDAMLDAHDGTTGARDPVIAQAYRQVAEALDDPNTASPWHGLSRAAKVDEVMATVLGRAMESKDFWTSLYSKSPRGAHTLRDKVLGLARKVRGTDAKSKTLAAGLGKQLAAAEEGGVHIREVKDISNYWTSGPLTQSQRLDNFYRGRGMAMLDDLEAADRYLAYRDLLGKGDGQQMSLTEFDALLDDLAPIQTPDGRPGEAGMTDRSGTPVDIGPYDTIIRNRAITTDPRLWLFSDKGVFGSAKAGTPERAIFDKWKAKHFKVSDKSNWQDISAAMREAPLVKITDLGNGRYDIHVIRDDDFPKWWENRAGVDYGDRALVAFNENVQDIEKVLRKLAMEVQRNKGSTADKLAEFSAHYDESEGHAGLLAEFGQTTEAAEAVRTAPMFYDATVQELSDGSPVAKTKEEYKKAAVMARQAFLISYREFVAKKLDEFRMEADGDNYKNIYDRYREVDLLARFEEDEPKGKVDLGPKESHQDTLRSTAMELDRTWAKVIKDGIEQPDGSKVRVLSDYTLEQGAVADGRVVAEIERVRKLVREDVEELLLQYQDAWFDLHGDDIVTPDNLKATTDVLADLQMDRTIPNWRKIKRLQEVVDSEGLTDSLDDLKARGELDEENRPIVRQDFTDPDEGGATYMARKDGETDDQFGQRARETLEKEVAKARMSAKQANVLDRARLKREHGELSKYLTDHEGSTNMLIQKELQTLGLATPEEGGFTAPKKLGDDLAELQSALDREDVTLQVQDAVMDRIMTGAVDLAKDAQARALYSHLQHELRWSGGDMDAAVATVRSDLVRSANSKKLAAIGAYKARTVLNNKAKLGLDHVYSFADGISRPGVPASGRSIAAEMKVLRDMDTSPLASFIDQVGLKQKWEDNEFMKELEVEANGVGKGDPIIRQLVTLLQTTRDMQAGRLNSMGANIRHMEGQLWSVVHNPHRMKALNERDFAAKVSKMLDLEKMERLHGHNAARMDGTTFFDPELFLKQFHHEATDPGNAILDMEFDPNTDGGNLANQVSRRKTMIFKPGEAFGYDMEFGSGNTGALIFSQIGRRAEVAGLMKHLGPDYKATLSRFMAEQGGANQYTGGKLWRIDQTFKMLTGELDHPVNQNLSVIGKMARNYANSVVAWMSGVSSVTDLGNMASTLRFIGGSEVDYSDMLGALKDRVAELRKGGEHEAFLRGNSVGLQAVVGAYSRLYNPVSGALGPMSRGAQSLSDLTFKWSGLEASGKAQQGAFMDVLTRIIGEQAKKKTVSKEFAHWLGTYGISPEDFKRMAAHASEIEGLEGVRLSPDMIRDPGLAMALRVAMRDSMDYAVLQPSVSTEALLRFGTKAGTPLGEAVRCVGHFKSYPIDMVRKITRRFDNGYAESFWSWDGSPNRAQKEKLIWAATMIGLGAMAISMKDMLRGREPLNPFDSEQWNLGNLTRVVAQAGVGPFAVIEQYISPRQLMGPAPGIAFQLMGGAADVVTGQPNSAYSFTNSFFGALPGASVAPVTEARKAVLGAMMPETMGAPYQRMLIFRELETGQGSIYSE